MIEKKDQQSPNGFFPKALLQDFCVLQMRRPSPFIEEGNWESLRLMWWNEFGTLQGSNFGNNELEKSQVETENRKKERKKMIENQEF